MKGKRVMVIAMNPILDTQAEVIISYTKSGNGAMAKGTGWKNTALLPFFITTQLQYFSYLFHCWSTV